MMAKVTANNFQPKNLPELMTPGQAAALLGVHEATVRRMAVAGSIPAYRLGEKLWRIPKRAVLEQMGIAPGTMAGM